MQQKILLGACLLLGLCAAILIYSVWPRQHPPLHVPPQTQNTAIPLQNTTDKTKKSDTLSSTQINHTQQTSAALNNRQAESLKHLPIKTVQPVPVYQGPLAQLDWQALKESLSATQLLSYLRALGQCQAFYRYAQADGVVYISQQRLQQTQKIYQQKNIPEEQYQALKSRVELCQGVPLSSLMQLYPDVEKIAESGNIEAMLWLSHLSDLRVTAHPEISKKAKQKFLNQQLVWLERAAQSGSLTAVFNLAVRFENSQNPDIVNALAHYEILQSLNPDYQLSDKINELSGALKTWQRSEVQLSKKILYDQLSKLDTLYQ